MNFYFDIDDTVAYTTETLIDVAIKFDKDFFNRNTVIDYNKNINTHMYFAELLNWSTQDLVEFYENVYPDYLKLVYPKENASAVIRGIHKRNHKIIFISARVEKDNAVYELTEKWLKNNGFCFDELIINNNNKAEYLSDKEGYYFDDSYEFCKEASENNKLKVIQISTKYGKKCNEPQIIHMNDWKEIESFIKNEVFDK